MTDISAPSDPIGDQHAGVVGASYSTDPELLRQCIASDQVPASAIVEHGLTHVARRTTSDVDPFGIYVWDHQCSKRPPNAPRLLLPLGEQCDRCGASDSAAPVEAQSEREAFLTWAEANLTPGQVANIKDSMERGESVSFAIWCAARGVKGPEHG